MITNEDIVVAAPDACWGVLGENLLLFDPHDRRLHVLNGTAAMVWALTEDGMRIADLVVRLGDEYREAPSEIEGSVFDVVDRLVDARLCLTDGDSGSSEPRHETVPRMELVPTPSMLGPFDVLGSLVQVAVDDRDLAAELARVLAPLRWSGPVGGSGLCYRIDVGPRGCDLTVNGRVLALGTSRSASLRTLLSDLNVTPLETLENVVALHAAAVEIDDGVVVLPGVSNSGKSTLAAQLVERGHGYLTDEAVVIGTGDLRARPYPKALCLEPGSQSVLPHLEPPSFAARGPVWDVDPATIGPGRTSRGGRVATLVFPIYRPRATAVVRRMDPVEVLHRLLRNTFALPRLDQSGFAALIRLADESGAFELAHGGTGHLELVEQVAAEGPTISL